MTEATKTIEECLSLGSIPKGTSWQIVNASLLCWEEEIVEDVDLINPVYDASKYPGCVHLVTNELIKLLGCNSEAKRCC